MFYKKIIADDEQNILKNMESFLQQKEGLMPLKKLKMKIMILQF